MVFELRSQSLIINRAALLHSHWSSPVYVHSFQFWPVWKLPKNATGTFVKYFPSLSNHRCSISCALASGSHHSGSPLPHSFKHISSPEPSRTQAVPHSSQEPGPSTDAHTQSCGRSDDKSIPDEPPIQSECGWVCGGVEWDASAGMIGLFGS